MSVAPSVRELVKNTSPTHTSTVLSAHVLCQTVCPEGLVVYKDRCVDPLECHSLINRTSFHMHNCRAP